MYSHVQNNRENKALIFYGYFFRFIYFKVVKQRIPFSWNCQGETIQELCHPVYFLV